MIFDPTIFYSTYLLDYHGIKSNYIKKILDNLDKYEKEFFDEPLDEEEKQRFRLTLKSDLRQTYFHAIETFFELFFSLDPKTHKEIDDKKILFRLTNSNWTKNYERIKNISTGDITLDYFNEKILVNDKEISIGQYLFYKGFYSFENIQPEFFKELQQSLLAIQYGIKILAQDFVNREEYNAYKHGLRIIPAIKSFMLADAKTMEIKIKWDLNDSMSFYLPTKDPNEINVVTKLFDMDRDYLMTTFCSNLIKHLIFYRRLGLNLKRDLEKYKQIPIPIFGIDPIDNCNKTNVEIQDIVYSIKRIKGKSKEEKFELKIK
jgi:hypothetical protein